MRPAIENRIEFIETGIELQPKDRSPRFLCRLCGNSTNNFFLWCPRGAPRPKNKPLVSSANRGLGLWPAVLCVGATALVWIGGTKKVPAT